MEFIHIIDNRSPLLQIRGDLVDKLLSVSGIIALIRVVANQFSIAVRPISKTLTASSSGGNSLSHKEWLPNRRQAVIWHRLTTTSNVAHKLPGQSLIM